MAVTNVPITPKKLTGDILHAFYRRYLTGKDLAEWAESLLTAGFDSDAITIALGNPDMHWERVSPLFTSICLDVGLSNDITSEIAGVTKLAMIAECRHGLREPAEILWRFDDLRRQIRFPEMIEFKLLDDNAEGKNDSGFYGIESRKHGKALDQHIRECMAKAGISL